MTVVGERKLMVLQAATEAGFFDDGGDVGARQAAAKLNGAGLLARDPKRANLWYPTVSGLNELRMGVDDARALLASGDVMRARSLADVVYTQGQMMAKAAAGLNLRESLDACHRIQADALKISAHAQVRIADAWDDLAEAGKVLKGRPKSVPDENAFSAEQAGLDRKQIFHARQLRDAEKAQPGFIDRVVEARIEAGLEPTRASLKANIGTKAATKEERGNQLYETPREAIVTLLALENFSRTVWEPSCGRGAISRELENAGYDVLLSDLIDYQTCDRHGECQQVGDFLRTEADPERDIDIVTNPPYGDVLNAYMAHALRVHKPRKMALLLNINAWFGTEDDDRTFAMRECPPSRIYSFSRRLPMMHRDGWDGPVAGSSMNTAWFVWERNPDGSYGNRHPLTGGPQHPFIIPIDWKDFVAAEAWPVGRKAAMGRALSFAGRIDAKFQRETVRKDLPERVAEERARAREWVLAQVAFTRRGLRQAIGVRDGVAEPLIVEFLEEGIIGPADGDGVYAVIGRAECAS